LLDTAENDFALSVRRAAAYGLGRIHWEQMPTAEVPTAQQQCLDVLLKLCQDSEWVVRYAAIAAIEALIQSNSSLFATAKTTLEASCQTDIEIGVKARAGLVLKRVTE
jgi:phycocyanobilin lyase beta subunit